MRLGCLAGAAQRQECVNCIPPGGLRTLGTVLPLPVRFRQG